MKSAIAYRGAIVSTYHGHPLRHATALPAI
jgi:hypothetical protein